MADVSAVVTPGAPFEWVYDPVRDVIHIVTTGGGLLDWSVGQKAYTLNTAIGGTPVTVDVSPDGGVLLVGNSSLTNGQATLTRVDLSSLALTTISLPAASQSTPGVNEAQFTSDGSAFVLQRGSGSGGATYLTFQPDSANPVVQSGRMSGYNGPDSIRPSEDHRYLLLEESGISNGPLALYDSVAGAVIATNDLYNLGTSGYQTDQGDVSSAAGLVANLTYTNILVLDTSLKLVRNLSSYQSGGSVLGVAFNDGGHQLFLWQGQARRVLVIDTLTWQQVGSVSVTTATSYSYNGAPYGHMDVTAGGRALILDADSKLEVVDLAQMSLTVAGGSTDDRLFGAVGADVLTGGLGADTLTGGAGRDTLSGGGDADLFVFAPGDSAAAAGGTDLINDWQVFDHLSFGGAAATVATYGEATAQSFAEAQAFANAQIAAGRLDYVAVQVGGDVVVFADSRNNDGVADDAVTLLGRTLADIDVSTIVPPPPSTAPKVTLGTAAAETLAGGAGDEAVSAGDGDDVLLGSAGNDTLNGGAGFDTVSYAAASGGVRANLATTTVQTIGGGMGSDLLSNVERLIGGAFGDVLTGRAGADTLSGGEGDDTLTGGGGADLLSGESGADSLSGGGTLSGGDGNDTLVATVAGARLLGGEGADSLTGLAGSWFGEGGADTLIGPTSGASLLDGGSGDDSLRGGSGADTLSGGAGADTLNGNGGADIIAGEAGADLITGAGVLSGGADADTITATGAATISGGLGDDSITGASAGVWYGEDGDDTLSASNGFGAGFTLDGGLGADSLRGSSANDLLQGGDGADTIDSGAGLDTLSGGAGPDRFLVGLGQAAPSGTSLEMITDWSSEDRLVFAGGAVAGATYLETSAADLNGARALANSVVAAGSANFVAVQVGGDVLIFVDSANNDGTADDAVMLAGRSLADVDISNFPASGPFAPRAPTPGPGFSATGTVTGNMDLQNLADLNNTPVTAGNETTIAAADANTSLTLVGNFTYTADGVLNGGTVTYVSYRVGPFQISINPPATPALQFATWLANDATQDAFSTLLAGSDRLNGSAGVDLIRGYAGDDLISGFGGSDALFGGAGNDVLYATSSSATGPVGSTYLRGDEGDDFIIGGSGFDDINGNTGNDTVVGGAGSDWAVGGKDDDMLFGQAGDDIVYGNLGADTCVGGDGADIVRGGQGNDVLYGDAGDDWLSGDRGDDTVAGGLGADVFHGSQDAGIDRVIDFNPYEGDRVQLDPGTVYTVSQSGSDVLINMGGGNYMLLVGVQLSSLPGGWIFGG